MKKYTLAIVSTLPFLLAASSEEMLMAGEWAETMTALSYSGTMPPPPNGLNKPRTTNRCITTETAIRDFLADQFGKDCTFGAPSEFDIANGKLTMAATCRETGLPEESGVTGNINMTGNWTSKSYDFVVSGDMKGTKNGKPMNGEFAAKISAKRIGECNITNIDSTNDAAADAAAKAVEDAAEAVKAAADVRPSVQPKTKPAPRKTRKRR